MPFGILKVRAHYNIVYYITGSAISGRGGAVKLLEEKGDSANELINHKAVYRAARGFARMC